MYYAVDIELFTKVILTILKENITLNVYVEIYCTLIKIKSTIEFLI